MRQRIIQITLGRRASLRRPNNRGMHPAAQFAGEIIQILTARRINVQWYDQHFLVVFSFITSFMQLRRVLFSVFRVQALIMFLFG